MRNETLPNFMMRDPVKRAVELDSKGNEEIFNALERIFSRLPSEKQRGRFLILHDVTRPRHLIDAKADAHCFACNSECWVAPSSRAHLDTATIICTRCINQELMAGTGSQ